MGNFSVAPSAKGHGNIPDLELSHLKHARLAAYRCHNSVGEDPYALARTNVSMLRATSTGESS